MQFALREIAFEAKPAKALADRLAHRRIHSTIHPIPILNRIAGGVNGGPSDVHDLVTFGSPVLHSPGR